MKTSLILFISIFFGLIAYSEGSKLVMIFSDYVPSVQTDASHNVTASWSSSLQSISEMEFIDQSKSSETTFQGLLRFPLLLDMLQPSACIIAEGKNDWFKTNNPFNSCTNLIKMAHLAKEKNCFPIICGPLPVFPVPGKPRQQQDVYLSVLNSCLKKRCKKEKIPYIDFRKIFIKDPDWKKKLIDGRTGNLPTDIGNQLIVKELKSILEKNREKITGSKD